MANSTPYGHDYFEKGIHLGISGYANYSWMPELTMRMAHFMITKLGLHGDIVLDFGCAKGYLVHAFRLLEIEAYGCDVSSYAIDCCPSQIRNFLFDLSKESLSSIINDVKPSCIIAKDVLEHLDEKLLRQTLRTISRFKPRIIFVAVPLSNLDDEPYIVPSYEADVTHILRKSRPWWISLFHQYFSEYTIDAMNKFQGCKDNWTNIYPGGNLFILASLP